MKICHVCGAKEGEEHKSYCSFKTYWLDSEVKSRMAKLRAKAKMKFIKKASVTLLIDCPDQNVSEEDFIEWVKFELGIKLDISIKNMLEYAEISNYIKHSKITTQGYN